MMIGNDIANQAMLAQAQTRAQPNSAATSSARQTAEEFEAFFLARFIDAMQVGLKTDGPFGGGHGEEMFRGMLSDEYAKTVVRSGGIGIADAVEREMLRIQEAREQ
jgi:Rod binding domain-containing protein